MGSQHPSETGLNLTFREGIKRDFRQFLLVSDSYFRSGKCGNPSKSPMVLDILDEKVRLLLIGVFGGVLRVIPVYMGIMWGSGQE